MAPPNLNKASTLFGNQWLDHSQASKERNSAMINAILNNLKNSSGNLSRSNDSYSNMNLSSIFGDGLFNDSLNESEQKMLLDALEKHFLE
jgi:hypothetical protein